MCLCETRGFPGFFFFFFFLGGGGEEEVVLVGCASLKPNQAHGALGVNPPSFLTKSTPPLLVMGGGGGGG